MCMTAAVYCIYFAKPKRTNVGMIKSVPWNRFACLTALKPNMNALRSFPASSHGSLNLADACLALWLILDKVRNFTTHEKKKSALKASQTDSNHSPSDVKP